MKYQVKTYHKHNYCDVSSDKIQQMAITPLLLNDHNTTAPDEVEPHKDPSSQTTAIEDILKYYTFRVRDLPNIKT